MWHANRRFERLKTIAAGALLTLVMYATPAAAHDWEMRVCADPISLPFSNRDGEGFENRIADILAEELNAKLTFVWALQDSSMISDQLGTGNCDVIMGIPDGYAEVLNTLAYYRSPYVFVFRSDSPFSVTSLDDPILHELTIGVSGRGIPPHEALLKRELADRVTLQVGAAGSSEAASSLGLIVDAVANGEVDLGLAWGPVASYYAEQYPGKLTIQPVTPQIDPPFLSMLLSMTIGVRQGDEALRDRLSLAISNRWDDIQHVLQEYGVPLSPLPKPVLSIGER